MSNSPYTREAMKARYDELCKQRDETLVRIQPLRDKLDAANTVAEEARVVATNIAREIYEARGGQAWFALKKEIGLLAKMLSNQKQ